MKKPMNKPVKLSMMKIAAALLLFLILTIAVTGPAYLSLETTAFYAGMPSVYAAGSGAASDAWASPRPEAVIDEPGLLTDQERETLISRARAVAEQYRFDVAVLVVESIGNADSYDKTVEFYRDGGYGYGEEHSGILLMLSDGERDFAFFSTGSGNTIFTEYGHLKLEEMFLPSLRQDEYFEAFSAFINGCEETLRFAAEHNGTPLDKNNDPSPIKKKLTMGAILFNIIACVLVPVGIAALFCSSAKSKMKTAKLQRAAQVYIPEGGFNLQRSDDVFINRTETRTKIQPRSSSSSGGGSSSSRSGGGGSGRSGKY